MLMQSKRICTVFRFQDSLVNQGLELSSKYSWLSESVTDSVTEHKDEFF